jgi:hypothetical protein
MKVKAHFTKTAEVSVLKLFSSWKDSMA